MVITRVPGGPPWPEFGMHLPTIPPKVFPCPKDPNLNQIKGFKHFEGVIQMHNPINRDPVYFL